MRLLSSNFSAEYDRGLLVTGQAPRSWLRRVG